jgi:hypothetical protein
MGAVSWLQSPTVELVTGRLLRLWREGREPNAMELLSDVEEEEVRADVSEVLASDEAWLAEEVLEKAERACLIRLRISHVERRRTRATRELSSLQRHGDAGPELVATAAQAVVGLNNELLQLKGHLQDVMRGS